MCDSIWTFGCYYKSVLRHSSNSMEAYDIGIAFWEALLRSRKQVILCFFTICMEAPRILYFTFQSCQV